MSRVKTFDSTGVAPNGVFYAGDANAIQDHYADLSNYSQTVDIGTLRVGESGLQLLRYATSPLEARVTAAFRADGIVRGLSGLFAGTFTTAQRDAIAAGSRPYGLVILNTSTNQLEINLGSDATPSWSTVGTGALPVGTILPYTGGEGSVPADFGLADGGAISRATYAALNTLYSTQSYPFGNGDGSTTFNKPDLRGRTPTGRDNMGGTAASRMPGVTTMGAVGGSATHSLVTGEMPAHAHGGGTVATNTNPSSAFDSGDDTPDHSHTGTTGNDTPDHTHSGTTGGQSVGHTHTVPSVWHGDSGVYGFASGTAYHVPYTTDWASYGASATHVHGFTTGGRSVFHQHPFTSAGANQRHHHSVGAHTHPIPSLTINSEGGSAGHNNLQPYVAINWIVKLR